eukprot:COSAG02_NODE_60607_length_271_cov_0.418605_2_plen_48_part_01
MELGVFDVAVAGLRAVGRPANVVSISDDIDAPQIVMADGRDRVKGGV